MLQNMTVRSRMLFFAAMSALFTAAVGILGLFSLRASGVHEKDLYQNVKPCSASPWPTTTPVCGSPTSMDSRIPRAPGPNTRRSWPVSTAEIRKQIGAMQEATRSAVEAGRNDNNEVDRSSAQVRETALPLSRMAAELRTRVLEFKLG